MRTKDSVGGTPTDATETVALPKIVNDSGRRANVFDGCDDAPSFEGWDTKPTHG